MKKYNKHAFFSPKIVEAHGSVVPKDSMATPKVIPVGKLHVVPVGKPQIVTIPTNVHPIGNPKVLFSDIIKVVDIGNFVVDIGSFVVDIGNFVVDIGKIGS